MRGPIPRIATLSLGGSLQRIINATRNTWRGLVWAINSEAALREEIIALAIAVPLALFITDDGWKRALLIGVVLLVIAIELLNTAIEKLCDHVTPSQHTDIGRIKDMGSAAVGVTLVIAGLVWLAAIVQWMGVPDP